MRKHILIALVFAGAFLFAAPARAQFTTVTATITDPNGIPYAGATMSAILVPGSAGGYTLGGQPYSGRIGPVTLDSTGKFTANFGDVTLITPGSPQWLITIDSNPGGVSPPLGTGSQTFTYTSTGTTISGGSVVSLSSALTALAPKLTNITVGSGTVTSVTGTAPIVSSGGSTPAISCPTCSTGAGSVVLVPATTAANTIAPTANSVVGLTALGTTGTGTPDIADFCTNSAGACGTKEFFITPAGVATANGQVLGTGSASCITPAVGSSNFTNTGFSNSGATLYLCSGGSIGLSVTNTGPATPLNIPYDFFGGSTNDTGLSRIAAGVVGVGTGANGSVAGTIEPGKYATGTNCSSSAAPAVCGSAAAGSVVVAAAGTTVTVNTTAVTANSQIFVMYDSSLGAKLSVTCNVTEPALYGVTARTAATSFVITSSSPTTNPACFSYFIVN